MTISVLIGVLIIVVVGAICFWAFDKCCGRPIGKPSQAAGGARLPGGNVQRVLVLTY